MKQENDDRWFVILTNRAVLDHDTEVLLAKKGAQFGGGWTEVHQHIFIDYEHQTEVIESLREQGYRVASLSDTTVYHPECGMCGLPPGQR